jgi:hypothetical protein
LNNRVVPLLLVIFLIVFIIRFLVIGKIKIQARGMSDPFVFDRKTNPIGYWVVILLLGAVGFLLFCSFLAAHP